MQDYVTFLKEFVHSYANLQNVQNQFHLEANPIPELDPCISGDFIHIPEEDVDELRLVVFGRHQHWALRR